MRTNLFGAMICCVSAVAIAASHPQASGPPLSPTLEPPPAQSSAAAPARQVQAVNSPSSQGALVTQYCVTCHNQRLKTGGLALDTFDVAHVDQGADTWEKVVRKLRGGLMPPVGLPRPDPATYNAFTAWLETELDRAAGAHPNAGRTNTFHRLNRAEYQNAIRDVLALDVDVASLLPADDTGYGFDNNAGVLRVSEALMEQYLSAARKISREALGTTVSTPSIRTFRVKDTERQDLHREGLPFGTRGGTLVRYNFPQDGEYDITVKLYQVARFPDKHELEVTIDGERVQLFTLEPRTGGGQYDDTKIPGLEMRVTVKAGPRDVAAAFLQLPSTREVEAARARFERPYYPGSQAGLGQHLAVYYPAVYALAIRGPYNATGPGDTPSRRRIFECRPSAVAEEAACAQRIVATLARRAFRRPVTDADLQPILAFYNDRRLSGAGFESGIEIALQRMLMSPEFLFRGEAEPATPRSVRAGPQISSNYRITDLELASRLSFFLWSSIPDDQLIDLAARGRLSRPGVLEEQVRRMVADPRADALVSNFIGQWLYVRNLRAVTPSLYLYPNFDDSLRDAFQRETELFFASVLRGNRSALDLLRANYTFVDERLATHYAIPNVKGSQFRRVEFNEENPRRGLGLLAHGSILTVSSRPNRTSPVLRGKFILDNLLGTPPPPPPANVPPLGETDEALGGNRFVSQPSMRERMAQHRANPTCAGCHRTMDPLGFALENFDAVGQWRAFDERHQPIDTSGVLPNGMAFKDLDEFRSALLTPGDRFAATITERLLIYALGRGLEYYDMPSVRRIVRAAAPGDYSLMALVQGIVRSDPFLMRSAVPSASVVAAAR